MKHLWTLFLGLVLTSSTTTALAQGSLWVVDDDPGPGVDFQTLQAGIDAAAEGDAILLRAGNYAGAEIVAKSLALVGEEGAVIHALSIPARAGLYVRDLSAAQAVTIQGIDIHILPVFIPFFAALRLTSNEGSVWIEDCIIDGHENSPGVTAWNCPSVAMTRCVVEVDRGSGAEFSRSDALVLSGSHMSVYDSTFVGGDGRSSAYFTFCEPGTPAGHGASLEQGSSLYASSCSFTGGEGTDGLPAEGKFAAGHATDGGTGVVVSQSAFEWTACTFAFGLGGVAVEPTCDDGVDGQPVFPGVPSDYEIVETPRSLASNTPIRESESVTLTFTGEPFDFLVLGASANPLHLDFPPFLGTLLVGFPSVTFKFGLIPASGTKQIGASVGLGPTDDFAVLYLQTAHFALTGEFVLSAPTALVVLDDAF